MPTVDLPGHDFAPASGSTGAGITDPDALASLDTSSYGWVNFAGDRLRTIGGHLNNSFDLFALPAGAIVEDVKFVALAYREAGGDNPNYDPESGWSTQTYPALTLWFSDSINPFALGYVFEPLPFGDYGWVESDIPPSQYKYVIQDWADQDPGFTGIGCDISTGPGDMDPADIQVNIAYLAIRITYSLARRLAHNRIVQRGNDGLGITGGRRILGTKTLQSSNRATGIR